VPPSAPVDATLDHDDRSVLDHDDRSVHITAGATVSEG
jgi:hypothetical protein